MLLNRGLIVSCQAGEGGVYESAEVEKINEINPYAVVIGSAITRPAVTAKRFNSYLKLK